MKLEAINHIPKSHMAYAFDANTMHIILQTAKNDVKSVKLLLGDPFEWHFKDGKYVWSGDSLTNNEMKLKYTTELFDYYFISIKTITTRSKYSFIINDGFEDYFYGCRDLVKLTTENKNSYVSNLFGYFNYPYINEGDLIDSPSWAKDIVWYQIFPDRFSRDDDNFYLKEQEYFKATDLNDYFFGGTIKGITKRIPYLKELGITGIYFTPIFKSVSSHKYDISDYYEIDPSFGSKEDLGVMIKECHKNNIKVMLDAVFNHCGFDHPYFQDVVKNKRDSMYWDCFFIEDDNFINFKLDEKGYPIYKHLNIKPNYRTFAFTPMMPKWNTDNPIAEEYLLDVATYWIKEYDIDGWRLDVSNEVSHRFWRKFKEAVRNIKHDFYILGENWDDSTPWLRGDQFDAVMNYEVAYPIWQYFGRDKSMLNISIYSFIYKINKLLVSYPENIAVNMFNMIGSHDTSRILQKCSNNPNLVKLAYTFLLSFGGSPALYYGDEVGLSQLEDKDPRQPMIWDHRQDLSMYNFFKNMIKLRKENTEFKQVELNWLENSQNVLIYNKGSIYFFLNNNEDSKTIDLPDNLIGKNVVDLFENHDLQLNLQLEIEGYEFKILKN